MKVAVLFDNFGPYHRARLQAAAGRVDLLALEFGAKSATYAWTMDGSSPFKHLCLNPGGSSVGLGAQELRRRLHAALNEFAPDVVTIPGWSRQGAIFAMQWARTCQVPVILMSESTPWDHRRSVLGEAVKRRYVGMASAALVGGRCHQDYLVSLGMPRERIALGYDAIDNQYFIDASAGARRRENALRGDLQLPRPFFLASARFIAKKNLPGLLRAYARYRDGVAEAERRDLVLLGDGELRPQLEMLVGELNLGEHVHLPGFKQYADLPNYYALADAFIHPSTTEQWGLVVNEAMACGLPVIVSSRCGCAGSLVAAGENGWTFDPHDEAELARLLMDFSQMDLPKRQAMGAASQRIIQQWGPDRFARGLEQAASAAMACGTKARSRLESFQLRLLAMASS